LEDLIKESKLVNKDYGIIHFDSPDKRGIDVALLYQKKYFRLPPTANTLIDTNIGIANKGTKLKERQNR
jgi:hypothetical protein